MRMSTSASRSELIGFLPRWSQLYDDRLGGGVGVERLDALLTPVSRLAEAAEGQLNPAAGAVGVDVDLPAVDLGGDAVRAAQVRGPDRADQRVVGAVSQRDRLLLRAEGGDGDHRAEDLLLGDPGGRVHAVDQRGGEVGAAADAVG